MAETNENGGWRGLFAGFALALSVLGILWFFIAAAGTKLGLWDWKVGFLELAMGWGPKIVLAALAVSMIAILVALVQAPRKRPFILALAALLVSGLAFGRLLATKANAERLPPLHDIQTDWSNPILPSPALAAAREAGGALNPIEAAPVVELKEDLQKRWPGIDGRPVADVQAEAEYDPRRHRSEEDAPYRQIDTLVLPAVRPDRAYEAALALVAERGWDIVTADAAAGRIEATDTSFWFEFKDDVMIRILPEGEQGARIDIRSVSRVGLSDLGANAKRVRDLADDLEAVLSRAAAGPA